MGIKKKVIFILAIILILTSAHVYLKSKYNPMVVEMLFNGDLMRKDIKSLVDKYDLEGYLLNYEINYKGHTLIMTSGLDSQIMCMNIVHGENISDINMPQIVIGDKIADKYYNTEAPLGRKLCVWDREYKIIGIEKNSDIIYIPFNQELILKNWKKKRIKFIIPSKKGFYLTVENIENELGIAELSIIDKVIYKEKIYGYLNLLIILAAIIVIKYSFKLIKEMKNGIVCLYNKYKEISRIINWNQFLLDRKVSLIKIITKAMSLVVLVFSMYKTMFYLWIPSTLIPDNFFSLMSYIKIFKLKYHIFSLHLREGFSSIGIDTIWINAIIIVLIVFTLSMRFKNDIN